MSMSETTTKSTSLQVTAPVDRELKMALEEYASKYDLSIAQAVRRAVRKLLEDDGWEPRGQP